MQDLTTYLSGLVGRCLKWMPLSGLIPASLVECHPWGVVEEVDELLQRSHISVGRSLAFGQERCERLSCHCRRWMAVVGLNDT